MAARMVNAPCRRCRQPLQFVADAPEGVVECPKCHQFHTPCDGGLSQLLFAHCEGRDCHALLWFPDFAVQIECPLCHQRLFVNPHNSLSIVAPAKTTRPPPSASAPAAAPARAVPSAATSNRGSALSHLPGSHGQLPPQAVAPPLMVPSAPLPLRAQAAAPVPTMPGDLLPTQAAAPPPLFGGQQQQQQQQLLMSTPRAPLSSAPPGPAYHSGSALPLPPPPPLAHPLLMPYGNSQMPAPYSFVPAPTHAPGLMPCQFPPFPYQPMGGLQQQQQQQQQYPPFPYQMQPPFPFAASGQAPQPSMFQWPMSLPPSAPSSSLAPTYPAAAQHKEHKADQDQDQDRAQDRDRESGSAASMSFPAPRSEGKRRSEAPARDSGNPVSRKRRAEADLEAQVPDESLETKAQFDDASSTGAPGSDSGDADENQDEEEEELPPREAKRARYAYNAEEDENARTRHRAAGRGRARGGGGRRPSSAYNLFVKDECARLRQPPCAIAGLISKRWRNLSHAEMQYYRDKARSEALAWPNSSC